MQVEYKRSEIQYSQTILTKKKKNFLLTVCKQYSDIFYLKGDKLICIDAIQHEIKTSAISQLVNEQLYQLLFKHKQEIDKQIENLQN